MCKFCYITFLYWLYLLVLVTFLHWLLTCIGYLLVLVTYLYWLLTCIGYLLVLVTYLYSISPFLFVSNFEIMRSSIGSVTGTPELWNEATIVNVL